jgi:thiamine biosynthesis lipoprotein
MNFTGLTPYRFSHSAMGTIFEIVVAGGEKPYARQASQAFFSEIDRLEGLFSRFDPCSEIGQINLLKAGQSLNVGVDVYECLKTAFELQNETRGAFDINCLILEDHQRKFIPSRFKTGPKGVCPPVALSHTSDGFRVLFTKSRAEVQGSDLHLDLGGIGKGYALEKAAGLLADWDIDHVLIHAGTSTALAMGSAFGPGGHPEGWPVGIGGNWPRLRNKRFYLKNRGLSGSGTEVKGQHVFDSRKGEWASGHLAAWVSHPSAAASDALSTAFMVMDTDEVRTYCDSHPETWALVLIDLEHYEVYNKKRLKELPAG